MLELNPEVAATMLGSAGPPIRDLDPRPAPSPHFTGRESLLEALASSLTQQRRVILHGLAGVGKSQVAVAHDETRGADYAHRWWLDGGSAYALRSGLQAIAEELRLATATRATSIDEIHRELRRSGRAVADRRGGRRDRGRGRAAPGRR